MSQCSMLTTSQLGLSCCLPTKEWRDRNTSLYKNVTPSSLLLEKAKLAVSVRERDRDEELGLRLMEHCYNWPHIFLTIQSPIWYIFCFSAVEGRPALHLWALDCSLSRLSLLTDRLSVGICVYTIFIMPTRSFRFSFRLSTLVIYFHSSLVHPAGKSW